MAEKFVNYKPAYQSLSKIWYATTVGLQDGFQGGGKFCILMIMYLKNFIFYVWRVICYAYGGFFGN